MGRINKKKLIDSARAAAGKNGDAENGKNGLNDTSTSEEDELGRRTTETPTFGENANNVRPSGIFNVGAARSMSTNERVTTPIKLIKKRKASVSTISDAPFSSEYEQSDDYDYVAVSAKKSRKTSKKSKKAGKSSSRKSFKSKEPMQAPSFVEQPAAEQPPANAQWLGAGQPLQQQQVHVQPPPPPQEADEEYEVERIVDMRIENGRKLYRVRWKGYSETDDTWEDEGTLSCPDLVKKFHDESASHTNANKPKKTKKKSGRPPKGKKPLKKKPADSAAVAAEPYDPNKQWEVLRIVGFHESDGVRSFRIRWKGYTAQDDTWEPESNLSCKDLIRKYIRALQDREEENEQDDDADEYRGSPEPTSRRDAQQSERASKRSVARNRVCYIDMDE